MRPHDLTPRADHDPRHAPISLRRELLASGMSDANIRHEMRAGRLTRVRHGAYVATPSWDALDGDGRHEVTTRAVLRQARTDVVVSHTSALPLYAAPTWGIGLDEVHVTRRDGRAGRHEAGTVQHCGAIRDGDVRMLHGVPVMSPTRVALEVTTRAPRTPALVVVNDLLHRGLTTTEELEARYAEGIERWSHTLATDIVLRLANPACESVAESRAWAFFFEQHLPRPESQYLVAGPGGEVVARLDFAWPELKVWVEIDGKVKYLEPWRPGQSAGDVVIAEKAREDMVRELTGWRCIRVTWDDLAHPARLAARLRAALFPAGGWVA
ncbi:type IV toxin-antitoxin system AbiEi family antitoxin domain-containing protein [Nocardioides cremeus]|jgi:hypothetical protein|uniref:Type IV toxin-antitoxin system AbiEi family antitoxin domain-containing protein n=1 Tax=Nocardioides cremeus TaxID=3058044 RepID=A0ABT8TLV8_9ACTN|nr:type IV toxin-antitoxin system AbiEi family antitoxin domain-containing protein [Nocardioides cremeus]MDO3394410.1 type IV toxin-antitoxin system AbiEi family antitoxin domain-containing protein [Nocardioides cremeus]